MDKIDKKILSILQREANVSLSEISKKVGISTTPCWNRINKLEENKVITSRITVLDNKKINLPIIVFLSVAVSSPSYEWLNKFNETVMKYDQIIEAYRLTSSSTDYLLKIVSSSIEEYDNFQQALINEIQFSKMSSSIALKEIKKNNYLPLDFI